MYYFEVGSYTNCEEGTPMRVQTDQKRLLVALNTVMEAIPLRPVLPMLSNVLLRANASLVVMATDLDLMISTSVEDVVVEEEGAIAVPGRKLSEIVRELPPDKPIIVSSQDHRLSLEIAGGDLHRGVFTVGGVDPEDFPLFPNITEVKSFCLSRDGGIAPEDLAEMVSNVTFAASRDEQTRTVLCGVLCRARDDSLSLVATDGHRLAIASRDCSDLPEFDVIVPPRALNLVPKLVDGRIDQIIVSVSDSFIQLGIGGTAVVSRLMEGPYVAYEQILPASSDKTAIVANEDFLLPAVRRTSVLANLQTRQLRLTFTGGRIELTTVSPEIGSEAIETIPASYSGADVEIAFNASYLLDILRKIQDPDVVVELSTPVSATILKPRHQEEGTSQRYLLMPLRLGER